MSFNAYTLEYTNNASLTAIKHDRIDWEANSWPSFSRILELLEGQSGQQAASIHNKMAPLCDLGYFPSNDIEVPFESFFDKGIVFVMNDAANTLLMNTLAEIMIIAIHSVLIRGDQPRRLQRFIVFDEANRVKDSKRLEGLAREGRAFGVGLIIGTQYPEDMTDELSGALATKIFLYNQDSRMQAKIARSLASTQGSSEQKLLQQQLSNLAQFQAFIRSSTHVPSERVDIHPFFERVTE